MTLSARFLLSASAVLLLTSAASLADKKDTFILRLRFKGDSATYLNRGSKLLEADDLKGARANFDAAIRQDPDIWPAYLDRATVSAREGQWQAALQDCEVAARHRPGFFRTFVLRAMIYQRLGRDREALADLDKVFLCMRTARPTPPPSPPGPSCAPFRAIHPCETRRRH